MTSPVPTFLVRHGEVHNPHGVVYADLDGFGLSDLGRSQAAAAAERIPPGSTIVTSPLERAVETATIIGAKIGSDASVDEDLTEWHLGRRWAGHVWASLDDDFPGELAAYLDRPAEITFSPESLQRLAHRTADAIRHHRDATEHPLVIVSHQDPIQAARLALTDKPLADLHRDKPGHAAVITLKGSGNGGWRELELWAPKQGIVFPPIEP